jgi:hypothetical protein
MKERPRYTEKQVYITNHQWKQESGRQVRGSCRSRQCRMTPAQKCPAAESGEMFLPSYRYSEVACMFRVDLRVSSVVTVSKHVSSSIARISLAFACLLVVLGASVKGCTALCLLPSFKEEAEHGSAMLTGSNAIRSLSNRLSSSGFPPDSPFQLPAREAYRRPIPPAYRRYRSEAHSTRC